MSWPTTATGPANESGQTLTVTAVSRSRERHGHVHGDRRHATRPTADYNGTDSFTYTVSDNGTTNGVADPSATRPRSTITVTEVNDAPTRSTTAARWPRTARSPTIDVLANDSDGPGQRVAARR